MEQYLFNLEKFLLLAQIVLFVDKKYNISYIDVLKVKEFCQSITVAEHETTAGTERLCTAIQT